jgi:hypothetical protein
MKKQFLLFPLLLSTLVLSECSKVDEVTPSTPTDLSITDVKVSNDRLVFSSQQVFDNTLTKLSASTPLGLDDWSKTVNFKSLRKAYIAELPNIERLIESNQAPAYALIEEFGLPDFYTVILNSAAEYQIGNKIYWFHNKFIYEANSEKELMDIKQNPAICKTKYITNSSTKNQKVVEEQQKLGTNSTTAGRTSQGGAFFNQRYAYEYNLYGDSRSRRRFIIGTRVFAVEQPRTNNGNTQNWRSYLNIQVRHQFYSFGNNDWYPQYGSIYVYCRQDKAEATVYVNNRSGNSDYFNIVNDPATTYTTDQYSAGADVGVGRFAYASNDISNGVASESDVYWTYEIDGQITVRNDQDTQRSFYVISGGPNSLGSAHMW